MTWGLSSATSQPPYAPHMNMRGHIDRGGYSPSYPSSAWSGGHGDTGWATEGWKGGGGQKAKSDNKAALSALTLLAFLYFLNLLQQQLLSTTGGQTLLFMVSGNGTGIGRRRRDAGPITFDTITENRAVVPINENFLDMDEVGQDSGAGRPQHEEDWKIASERLQTLINTGNLPHSLSHALTICRSVVACALHKATPSNGPPVLDKQAVQDILYASGENVEPGGLDVLCEDILATSPGECGELAKTFETILPNPVQRNLKHDPHDLL